MTCVSISARGVDASRFHLNTGDDLLEAETLMEDVVQRRRRVFGPAHPSTRGVEMELSIVRKRCRTFDAREELAEA